MAGRGWAWTAYDWDEGRLFNYIGDAQNTFPMWNASPLVALDVYEHAYFLDYPTDRASYIDAFFANLDWATVNDWVSKNRNQTAIETNDDHGDPSRRGYLARLNPIGVLAHAGVQARRHRTRGSGNIGANERLARLRLEGRRSRSSRSTP